MREFHLQDHLKTYLPADYKNNPHAYVAASDDGHVAGELLRDDAVVYMRTFYDERLGKRRFGECRAALNGHLVWHTVSLARTPAATHRTSPGAVATTFG